MERRYSKEAPLWLHLGVESEELAIRVVVGTKASGPGDAVGHALARALRAIQRGACPMAKSIPEVHHRTTTVGGVDVFYREAGDPNAPAVVLLHGFPT